MPGPRQITALFLKQAECITELATDLAFHHRLAHGHSDKNYVFLREALDKVITNKRELKLPKDAVSAMAGIPKAALAAGLFDDAPATVKALAKQAKAAKKQAAKLVLVAGCGVPWRRRLLVRPRARRRRAPQGTESKGT